MSNPMTADTTPSLVERLTALSALEDGWYANVGRKTAEACCTAMREAAAMIPYLHDRLTLTNELVNKERARAEAAEANARRLSEALATLQEQAQPLPKSYQWTGVKAAEDLFDMEVRHRNGSKPADYLRGWLGMFRPFAFATKDDSWGELEKLISITMRNYVQLLAAVAALTTKEADRGPE